MTDIRPPKPYILLDDPTEYIQPGDLVWDDKANLWNRNHPATFDDNTITRVGTNYVARKLADGERQYDIDVDLLKLLPPGYSRIYHRQAEIRDTDLVWDYGLEKWMEKRHFPNQAPFERDPYVSCRNVARRYVTEQKAPKTLPSSYGHW